MGVLEDVLAQAGITVGDEQLRMLDAHLRRVLSANKVMNLTAITDYERAACLHVVDSLLAAPLLGELEPGLLIDVGSGAGFPGVPLAIVSRRPVLLVEATGKKASFLKECTRDIGLEGVSVLHSRAEEFSPSVNERGSVGIARAVATLPALVELAVPLIADKGWFLAMKGDLEEQEREAGRVGGQKVGMTLVREFRYELPALDRPKRTVVLFQKTSESQIVLPRRAGRAQKSPLA